jgi:hypothetical protein
MPVALKINLALCIYGFCVILSVNRDISLNSINLFIFKMVKCSVVFEVRKEFLNII